MARAWRPNFSAAKGARRHSWPAFASRSHAFSDQKVEKAWQYTSYTKLKIVLVKVNELWHPVLGGRRRDELYKSSKLNLQSREQGKLEQHYFIWLLASAIAMATAMIFIEHCGQLLDGSLIPYHVYTCIQYQTLPSSISFASIITAPNFQLSQTVEICRLSTHHHQNGGTALHYDLVVVGGGIIGLATAREVATRHPDMRIALVEKEKDVGVCLCSSSPST